MAIMISKCGVNCARCPSFIDNIQSSEDRKRCSEGWEKYLGFRLHPDKLLPCEGCQMPDDEKTVRYQNCYVRQCAVRTGAETCAHCSAFPCEDVPLVSLSVDAKKRIAARIRMSIPEEDYLTFIEPYEGMKHLDKIRATLDLSDIVEKIEVRPSRTKVIKFTEDLPLSQEQKFAFEAVHNLLKFILLAQTETYARQLLFKRRKPHMLGLLWAMGQYGEIDEEDGCQLVLDGRTYGSKRECSWLVRKRDNSFYGAVKQATNLLQDYAVRCEFVPLEDGWLLKLEFDEEAGGEVALKALKKYVVGLSDQYGEPVYAGSCRLKGKAFESFAKADMRLVGTRQTA